MFDLHTFLRLCREHAKLGGAVQEQLDRIVAGAALSEMNPNALRSIAEFLRSADGLVEEAGALAAEIEDHLNPDPEAWPGTRPYDSQEEEGEEADPDRDYLLDDTEPAGGYGVMAGGAEEPYRTED